MKTQSILSLGVCVVITALVAGKMPAGEVTVEGSLAVKTNLTVHGQLRCATLSLTNLAISGHATIQELVPQGDLSMGPYTNRVAQ
jgi:hypothetical protein